MDESATSDKHLVRYLLGELAEDEAGELEQAVLADGELFERLCMAEDDLADAYARGELAGRERERFEGRFLASAEGRDRIAMARALAAAVDRRPAPEPVPDPASAPAPAPTPGEGLWRRLADWLAPPVPAARWAWAAVLVLAVGLTWVGRDLWLPGPGPAGAGKATFVLAAAVRGGELPRFAVGPDVGVVELRVDLAGDDRDLVFRARLETIAGDREIHRWADVRPRDSDRGRVLSLELPARRLAAGRYLLLVDSRGPDSGAGDYLEYEVFELAILAESD